MTSHNITVAHKDVKEMFEAFGISTKRPGFYDEPAFISLEQSNPSLLHRYAEFVRTRPIEDESHIRKEIQLAANFVYDKLQRSGKLGKCVDGSMLLSRVLESRGVWNYMVKGALTLKFRPELSIPDTHYWPFILKVDAAQYGHCWVVAPPYRVVDITINLQPYHHGEHDYLPDILLDSSTTPANVESSDLINVNEARRLFRRFPRMSDLEVLSPGLRARIEDLGASLVTRKDFTAKFIPTGVTAPDARLEDMCDGVECGQSPVEVVREYTQMGG